MPQNDIDGLLAFLQQSHEYKGVDPEVAKSIHESNQFNPYTTSSPAA